MNLTNFQSQNVDIIREECPNISNWNNPEICLGLLSRIGYYASNLAGISMEEQDGVVTLTIYGKNSDEVKAFVEAEVPWAEDYMDLVYTTVPEDPRGFLGVVTITNK